MLGFLKPKLPVSDAQRLWVDESFARLSKLLGAERMMDVTVMLPIAEHFQTNMIGVKQRQIACFSGCPSE